MEWFLGGRSSLDAARANDKALRKSNANLQNSGLQKGLAGSYYTVSITASRFCNNFNPTNVTTLFLRTTPFLECSDPSVFLLPLQF
jgi:hypothetical protein